MFIWEWGWGLSAVGYRLSAIGCRLSAIGYRLSAVGCRLSALVGAPKKIKGAIMIKPYNRPCGRGKSIQPRLTVSRLKGRPFYGQAMGQLRLTCTFSAECAQRVGKRSPLPAPRDFPRTAGWQVRRFPVEKGGAVRHQRGKCHRRWQIQQNAWRDSSST